MIILGVSGPQWLSEEWVGPGCRPWCVYEGWFAKLGVGTLAVMQGAVFFLCHVLALGCGWGGSGPGYVEQLDMERSGLILPALSGFALFTSLSLDLPPA